MQYSFLVGSAVTLAVCGPLLAASIPDASKPPAVMIPVAQPHHQDSVGKTTIIPCVNDLRAFSDEIHKQGYWGSGSDYAYGFPMGGYGYDGGHAADALPIGSYAGYAGMRPGYEVRNLLASANILARNGQQAACEAVLSSGREIYNRYTAGIGSQGAWHGYGAAWRQRQIASAQPVTNRTAAFRPSQLLDTDVLNARDDGLGSVHDLVISPKTGKIAYLIINRGSIFGFDETYVPVPWTDFKFTDHANLLVLDTTKAAMSAAPAMDDAQFIATGDFTNQSDKVDAYWRAALAPRATN